MEDVSNSTGSTHTSPGTIKLVAVPVLDRELGHLALDEELERLVAQLANDGVYAHGREPIAGV